MFINIKLTLSKQHGNGKYIWDLKSVVFALGWK